jgi:Na+(H+)/acetate symporter ActP
MQDQRERAKIDGRASFAGAAYLMGVGLIFLLGRVGAPDRLVQALGPLFALSAVALLGVLTRSTRVPTFFIADRAIPAPYGGLAFAAFAAGLVLCLGPDSPMPFAGVAIGLGLSGWIVGPLLRASGASALSDLLATRFPNPLLKAVFAGLLLAIGVFVAAAGFEASIDAFIKLFALSRVATEAIVAALVVMMIAPGGLAGLLWAGAACAGVLLIVLALPIVAHFLTGDAAIGAGLRDAGIWRDALAETWTVQGVDDPAKNTLLVLTSAIAIAALPPLTSPSIASFREGQALRAGALGVAFAGLIGFATFVDFVVWPSPAGPMSKGLTASAFLLCALSLCCAGVLSAARARGTNAGGAYGRYMPLASQRLARSRALMLAIVLLCAGMAYRLTFDPKGAIVVASALSLSLIAPALVLALWSRASAAHAIACVVVSVGTAVALGVLEGRIPNGDRLLIGALCAGAAGFAAGWVASIFSSTERNPSPARRDIFVDAPFDPGG